MTAAARGGFAAQAADLLDAAPVAALFLDPATGEALAGNAEAAQLLDCPVEALPAAWAHALGDNAALRRRLPGYATATPDTLQRRFLTTGGHVLARHNQIVVRLDRRTYSPVLRQADLPQTLTTPWLDGRTPRYEYA